ncbi:MAG TPA: type II secretion system F family protein [Phycisphaerales bacterium]|nr:type II secretion system F family protein [Phycisphaerales bacterium]
MPSFRYQGFSASGQSVAGVIAAPDRAAAVRQLAGRGETAIRLDAMEADERSAAREERAVRTARARRPSISRPELASLVRELATAVEAGLPLMSALRTVRRQVSGRAMPAILDHLIERVESGATLHQAAADYGPPFDDLTVGMLRAADASGRMSEVLHQLADLLDRQVELRSELIGATIYPLIVAALIAASVVVLITFVLPRLMAPLIAQMGTEAAALPFPTRVLLTVAGFIQSYWLFVILGLIALVAAWRVWSKIPANRLRIDLLLLRTPVLGRLLRDVAVARFTRTLGTLVAAGLPILQSLRIVRDTLGNTALMNAIDEVQDKVTTGASLADPLERSGLFPPLLVQIVNIGERSGRLESMLLHAATAFDRRVNTSLKTFSKALPPVLLVIMASIAGFVLAGIILPLIELQKAFASG